MSLRRFFRRRYWDEERARELQAYLAQEIDDNLARGMTPGQARAAAHRQLGNLTRIREEIYEINSVRWFDTVRLDLRDAMRHLRRRRATAITTAALLTLGIGASVAGFGIAYGTLLRPLPYPDPDRLVTLWQETDGRRDQISAPDFRDLSTIPAFESAALLWSGRATLTAGIDVDRVTTVEAEPPLLPMLGARALLGRLPGAADADQPIMAISHRLWRRVFHEDPAVVGRTVQVGGRAYTVVGVVAEGLDFELPVGGPVQGVVFTVKDVDLWTTFGAAADFPNTRQAFTFEALVKLRPGARLEQAQRATDTVASNLARQYPDTNRGRGFRLVPLREQIVGARAPAIQVGFAGALLILAIACVNAVSLALGELPARRRDFAVREALGAGRARLLRQVALESGVLALGSGIAGVALAGLLVRAFSASVELPRAQDVRFDLPVAIFAIAASLLAALVARLAPVLRLEGGAGGLRASFPGGMTHASSAPRLRRALVAAQLAMALVLCLTAALFAESLRLVLHVDPGFASAHTLSARLSAFAASYPGKDDVTRFYADLIARIAAVPGVSSAAAGSSLPLGGSTSGSGVMVEGRPHPPAEWPTVGWQSVTPGYFHTLGMPIRAGRDFTPRDLTRATHHVVINEALARRLFGSEDPIGRRLMVGPATAVPDWHEIVGVVGDVHHTSLTEPPAPRVYDLFGEHWARTLYLVVTGRGAPAALAPLLRREVAALNPGVPVFEVRSLDDLIDAASAQRRVSTIFAAGIAGASLLLAAIGVYGLLAGSVAARTREIGVRRALGSSSGRIMALVAREALAMSAAGVMAGLATAMAFARVIQAQLYGIAATDPRVMAGVAALLVGIAGLAALVPARRAAGVDPAITLRNE